MGRILTIKSKNIYHDKTRDQILPKDFKVGPVSIKFITIIVIALLALFYLATNQMAASRGFQVKDLEEKKAALEIEKEKLEFQAAKIRSIQNLKNEAEKLNLVPASQINFFDQEKLVQKP